MYRRAPVSASLNFINPDFGISVSRGSCNTTPIKSLDTQMRAPMVRPIEEIRTPTMILNGSHDVLFSVEYMKEILDWHDIKQIISGGAKGADKLAERYAADRNIPLKVFHKNAI